MGDRPRGHTPLSVRRGVREPFEFVEGIPEHARLLIDDWLQGVFYSDDGDMTRNVRGIVSALRLPFQASYPDSLISGLSNDDDLYLDVLDLITTALPQHRESLDQVLRTAGSVWRVDLNDGGLRSVVPDEALKAYARALETAPDAAQHLTDAWKHAFGRHPDAGDAWGDAIRAVEAVLSPIVIPKARLAKLSDIQAAVRAAPEGKFTIRAAGRNPQVSLSGMLDSIPYEPGRHGSDHTTAELQTARIVVLQATAIVAGVGEGLIERADLSSEEGA